MFFSVEDDSVTALDCPPLPRSRKSLAEQGDEVMPLWDSSYQSQNQWKKGKFSQQTRQTSDADSAIGMVCVCVCVCVHEYLLRNVRFSSCSLLRKITSFCPKFSDAEALLLLIPLVQPTILFPLNLLPMQVWKVRGKDALVPVYTLKSSGVVLCSCQFSGVGERYHCDRRLPPI